ncbi:MAG: deoxyribose-phosphate aldolase [Bacteroidetes bacterium GWC2_33_15]|nr:MAG: deoxyribose-phosphate aldolase [Bacteroidetes bacterium GWA2_33_15]OFX50835.1 MAG: deoxyribose-phosphate aldolase [Bacteroidetes bacterium GWC2_33_15]OFX62882.1 MAG: deoxyribose-phosphate aldolase [Bacteroidetes bacterium GWB2_32_14]OFX69952.1 MAG: deoxyribose-phosphate aldolase [Bacteroidetes bacterium GWD2_33_33]HAN18947.1 deoxyribose-phosphate aldolase [Bacteroidales bacterium]
MKDLFTKYDSLFLKDDIKQKVTALANNSHQYLTTDNLKLLFSLIDLTSLNTEDNETKIKSMTLKVNDLKNHYPDMPNVAAMCVYPSMVEHVKTNLSVKGLGLASVGAGFPSSQTYKSIKIDECKQAVSAGATEIDIVLSVGKFFEGEYNFCYNEIKDIKSAIGKTHLKVILESGALKSYQQIWEASILSMEAGADFIKTSTGKQNPAATLDAVYVMTKAIKSFYEITGKKIGIKPAGGIVTTEDALGYYSIVKENLGYDWLNNELFRIGASRLANNLLTNIYKKEIQYF